ncbi:hypothetical protein KR009_012346, partial [Drosophila setifemur]
LQLLLLAVILNCGQATETWQRLPTLDTFSTYEDMQRYFDQRSFRSMRHIDNPTDDSYLEAFNQYNEQLEGQSHARMKREQRELPTKPRMLRFEVADAVEPSPELKQIIRQFHARAMKESPSPGSSITTPQPPLVVGATKEATRSERSRKPRRQRRSTFSGQQPADFKVLMIPFEETDAREPDPLTAQLIKKARTLDLQSQATRSDGHHIKPLAVRKQPFQVRIRKTKRSKRSTPPQMIKFELADAKPLNQRTGKQLLQASPTLLTMETEAKNKTKGATPVTTAKPRMEDNDILTGEATAETKRMYVYKEAPQSPSHLKTKKSLSTLPHEVQKVITQLMKDGHGGKAYVKYMPAQKSEYDPYKAKSVQYGIKPLGNYVKYVKQAEPSPAPAPVQVHIQPVPVVEHLRYVYKPSYQAPAPTIAQPIVVQDAQAAGHVEEVHHTYTAELGPPPTQALDVIVPQFRPSKPDPLLSEAPAIYGKPSNLEQYQYEIQPEASPLIKIEYHAQADGIKEHYKQLPEFQQLSSLIGKSPDDQIHGLTYLLAKEMQAKLQRQGKQMMDRPQDSTAPILFHPGQVQAPAPTLKTLLEHGSLGVQPGRLIGMAKTKQYVPIIEPGNNDVKELPAVASSESSKLATPSSYIDYTHGHGLSQGYEGVGNGQEHVTTVEHVVHHPAVEQAVHYPAVEHAVHQPTMATLQHQYQYPVSHHHHHQEQHQGHGHGLVATVLPAELDDDKGGNGLHFVHNQEDKSLQPYASKYAFGYRIRDFHTGNDFGHKQNRDLHGVTRGQYHILLPDGRIQNVIYHADDTGFHADVSFESGAKH